MAAGVTLHEPYTRDILRLAAAIPHQQDFETLATAAEHRSRTCGSRVRVAVTLGKDGRVAEIRQAVQACAYGQAAAALMGARAIGQDLSRAKSDVDAVERWLDGRGQGWPELQVLRPALDRPGRHEAILLPFRALVAAIGAASR